MPEITDEPQVPHSDNLIGRCECIVCHEWRHRIADPVSPGGIEDTTGVELPDPARDRYELARRNLYLGDIEFGGTRSRRNVNSVVYLRDCSCSTCQFRQGEDQAVFAAGPVVFINRAVFNDESLRTALDLAIEEANEIPGVTSHYHIPADIELRPVVVERQGSVETVMTTVPEQTPDEQGLWPSWTASGQRFWTYWDGVTGWKLFMIHPRGRVFRHGGDGILVTLVEESGRADGPTEEELIADLLNRADPRNRLGEVHVPHWTYNTLWDQLIRIIGSRMYYSTSEDEHRHGDNNNICESDAPWCIATWLDRIPGELWFCSNCETQPSTINATDIYGSNLILCEACSEDYNRCCECGAMTLEMESFTYNSYDEPICNNCSEDEEMYCNDCDNYFSRSGMSTEAEGVCLRCDDPNNPMRYDYEPPTFSFHPSIPVGELLYMGAEAETEWPGVENAGDRIQAWFKNEVKDKYEDLIYIKTDGSLQNGYEIVTHPMQWGWAKEEFPWDIFDKLITEYKALDTHEATGGHVHLNKDAFTTPHLWKFLQVHLRCPELLGALGGRGTTNQWGSLAPQTMVYIKENLKDVAKAKSTGGRVGRYAAVNLLPPHTVELRYPAGGSSATLLKKNIGLAHAVYTFSKEIGVQEIRAGVLEDPGYLLGWILERESEYSDLAAYSQTVFPQPKSLATLKGTN